MKQSAGILPYRIKPDGLDVLLAHPGGPFWAKKDAGAWSIFKGECGGGEDPETAARREFTEETGLAPPPRLISLDTVRQAGGKIVHAYAGAFDCDPAAIQSNAFEMEWPPRSGRRAAFPEIDRAEWFAAEASKAKINPAQAAFLDRLHEHLRQAR